MATKNIEIQDSTGNIYYPHTDASIVKFGDSNVNATLSDLVKNISNDVILTPSMNYGMNNKITNTGEVTNSPKFTIQGKTVINLLGKDGNCEDVSVWNGGNTTQTLDATNKVFGSNGLKVVISSTTGYNYPQPIAKRTDLANKFSGKYLFLSVYIKNGNATNACGYLVTDGVSVTTPLVTDTTKFTRVGVKVTNATSTSLNALGIYITGTSGQYAYMDGLMINEITANEYNNLTVAQLLNNYPYVDSYTCLQNPYIEVRHDNLVRNGNGEEGTAWWTQQNYATMSIVNNKFQLVTTQNGWGAIQNVKLKPNTAYYLYGNVSGNTQIYVNRDVGQGGGIYRTGVGTFNTGSGNTDFYIYIYNATLGTGTADSIMLLEGTTAPSSYKPCRLERTVLETNLTSDDSITYKNGEVTGQIWWKHKTLYGKDYDWQYVSNNSGWRIITINPSSELGKQSGSGEILVKYNGQIVTTQDVGTFSTADRVNSGPDGQMWISVSDNDAGWSITPNNDEVKAFMNGWKALAYNGATSRYTGWVSVIDNSYPSGTATTTTTSAGTSTTNIIVSDSSKFSVSDYVMIQNGTSWNWGYITSIPDSTHITIQIAISYVSSAIVVKCDNGTTNTFLLNWCANNVAPNYDGYQLHYKLSDPETVTDDNCHIHGDIPLFDVGDNYLYLDSGIVLGEVTNPVLGNGSFYYWNNINYPSGFFKYPNEYISSIYLNNIFNNKMMGLKGVASNSYGNERWSTNSTDVDANAVYTVDYKILETQAPQIGTISCSYSQDINSAISNIQESLNNKQVHDSILDQIVDKSLYERIIFNNDYITWISSASSILYFNISIKFSVVKKAVPTISMSKLLIRTLTSGDITSKIKFAGSLIQKDSVILNFSTTNSTLISDIKNNGVYAYVEVTADCRDRI